jgi:hypothetical protein
MPRSDVTGAGSGSERRASDHSVCLFELWSPEISGPGASAYYRETLTGAMTDPKPLTYDDQKAAKAAFYGYPPNADWKDSAQEIYARFCAEIAIQRTTALTPQSNGTLRKLVGNL